jgi:hypothetical protein
VSIKIFYSGQGWKKIILMPGLKLIINKKAEKENKKSLDRFSKNWNFGDLYGNIFNYPVYRQYCVP